MNKIALIKAWIECEKQDLLCLLDSEPEKWL
jgi:hypothetical protein